MKTLRNILSIIACTLVLQISAGQDSHVSTPTTGKAGTYAIVAGLTLAALGAYYVWSYPEYATHLRCMLYSASEGRFGAANLHWAAHNGYAEAVRILLEHGADVNAQDNIKYTALHKAVSSDHIPVIKILAEYGANINAQTPQNEYTPLHMAADSEQTNVVLALIKLGATVDAQATDKNTALHLAAELGHQEVVRVLITYGTPIDIEGAHRQTALRKALEARSYLLQLPNSSTAQISRYEAIARMLVQHGAELNRVRQIEAFQNHPRLRKTLEHLSKERIRIINDDWCNYLRTQGLSDAVVNQCVLKLALPKSQQDELAQICEEYRANA